MDKKLIKDQILEKILSLENNAEACGENAAQGYVNNENKCRQRVLRLRNEIFELLNKLVKDA